MHEEDGHYGIPHVCIARKLQCIESHCGHIYLQMAGCNYVCPKCGYDKYDILDEYYSEQEMKGDADAT